MTAIDTRALGVAVIALGGGRVRADQAAPDGKGLNLLSKPEQYAAAARAAIADGYDAVKVDPVQIDKHGAMIVNQSFFGILTQDHLRMGEERACLAVRMVFDKNGKKTGHTFTRGLMRSAAKVSYEQAQAAIDGETDDTTGPILEPILD